MNITKCILVLVLAATGCLAGETNQLIVCGQALEVGQHTDVWIAGHIQKVVIDSAIAEQKITIPDELFSNCMDLYIASGGLSATDAVTKIEASAVVLDALRKVVEQHQNPDIVYEKYVRGQWSKLEWQEWLKDCDTKEKIDARARFVPHSVADLKRFSAVSLKEDLELWLLLNRESNTPDWWKEEIAKANISLPPGHDKVKALMDVPPPPPYLPPSVVSLLRQK